MRVKGVRFLLALFFSLFFAYGLSYGEYVKYVYVTWTQNGASRADVFQPNTTHTISRDTGTAVNVRVYKADGAPSSVEYFFFDISNNVSLTNTSTASYYSYNNRVGSRDTKVWAGIKTMSDGVTIYVNNLASQDPDLIVSNVTVDSTTSPGTYYVGDRVKVACIVWNQGDATAGSSYVGYYIGRNSSDTGDRWDRDSVSSLSKNAGSNEYEYYTFTSSDVGTRYFVLKADYLDAVDEGSSEGNNLAAFGPFTVQNPPNREPDITITAPASNTTVTQGQSVTISWNGSDPDNDTTYVSLGYDRDNVYNNGNHTWLATSRPEDGNYTWDTSGVATGTYYIFGMIYDGQYDTYDFASGTVTIQPVQYYSVSGRVTSRRWPYDGVGDVRVASDSGQSATTDGQGNYTITNVPSGSRTITAQDTDNDFWATGTSASASQSVSLNGNRTGVNFGDFACKGVASVTIMADKTSVMPGQTFNLTVTLSNTSSTHSLSDVTSYLDLSFSDANVTVGTASGSGWTSLNAYPSGSSGVWAVNSSRVWYQLGSSSDYLITANRQGTFAANGSCSFTVPITVNADAPEGAITLKYRGTIGDERDPDSSGSGTLDQQGLNVKTLEITVGSTSLTANFGEIKGRWNLTALGRSYSVIRFLKSGVTEYTLPFYGSADNADAGKLILDEEMAKFVLHEWVVQKMMYLDNGKLQDRNNRELTSIRDFHNLNGNFLRDIVLSVMTPGGAVLTRTVLNKRISERATLGNTCFFAAGVIAKAKLTKGASLKMFPLELSQFILDLATPTLDKKELEALLYYYKDKGDLSSTVNEIFIKMNLNGEDFLDALKMGLDVFGTSLTVRDISIDIEDVYKAAKNKTAVSVAKGVLKVNLDTAFDILSAGTSFVTGFGDFKKEVQAWGYVHDEHCDAIYDVADDLMKTADQIVQVRNGSHSQENMAKLSALGNHYVRGRTLMLPALMAELYKAQYAHIMRVRQNVWTPIAYFGGASKKSLSEASETMAAWWADWKNWRAKYVQYHLEAKASFAEYRAAVELLAKERTKKRLFVGQKGNNELQFKAGSTNTRTLELENVSDESVSAINISYPSSYNGVNLSVTGAPTSLAAGATGQISLRGQVPLNWFSRFNVTVSDFSAVNPYLKIPVTISYTANSISYQQKGVVNAVITPPGSLVSIEPARMSYEVGERVNVTVKFDIATSSQVHLVVYVYYPDGSISGIGGTSTTNRTYSFSYDITKDYYGSYGFGAYILDSSTGQLLVPIISCPRAFNVVPPIQGNDLLNYGNICLAGNQAGDQVVVEDLAETLSKTASDIVWTDGKSVDALLSEIGNSHIILVGANAANPLVQRLVDLGRISANRWKEDGEYKPGKCLVGFIPNAFKSGQHVVVIAGTRARDTEVAGIAFATYYHKMLNRLEVSGAGWVDEGTTALYSATAYYNDGSSRLVSGNCTWDTNVAFAKFSSPGVLIVNSVAADQSFKVTATYTENGVTKSGELTVNAKNIVQVGPEIEINEVANGGVLDFGSAAVGAQVTKSVTIRNTGNANLTISGLPLTISGTGAGQFRILRQPGATVAANGSTVLEILFTPSVAGAKSASVSIVSNDSNESPYSIGLSGTAVSAQKEQPDFNNDGKADLLLRNYTHGANQVWFMDGVVKTGSAALPKIANANWHFQCTGDFNGDGKPDIFLRDFQTGANQVWYMDGVAKTGYVVPAAIPDTNWHVEGTGDFNNDGKTDILMRNIQQGTNQVWFMDGVTRTGSVMLPRIPDLNWRFEGVADFNNDGKPDILMRNYQHGMNQVWYMDGTAKTGSVMLPVIPDLNWHFDGVADFNGDGKPDILMRNYQHGMNQVWFMDGVAKTGSQMLPTIPDVSWRIEN